jgi:hypothetical protein
MNSLRLSRSTEEIGAFISALGSLRETRLTAALGFLISRFPEELGSLLGLQFGPSDEIAIEETDGGDRYDVLIRNSGEEHIIEGKVGPYQSAEQLARYIARRRKNGSGKPALTIEPPPTPGLRREGSRGDEKGNSYQFSEPPPTPGLRRVGSRGVEKGNY